MLRINYIYFSILLGITLSTAGMRPTQACDPLAEWDEYTNIYLPIEENIPAAEGLLLTLETGYLPEFEIYSRYLDVEVMDSTDGIVLGHIEPTLLPGQVRWIPEASLVIGQEYYLTASLTHPVEHSFTVVSPSHRTPSIYIQPHLKPYDYEVLGKCLEPEDSCGECAQGRVLGTEKRFKLVVELSSYNFDWQEGAVVRVATGVSTEEAEAGLAEAPIRGWADQISIDAGRLADWGGERLCAAVEVVGPFDRLVKTPTRCVWLDTERPNMRDPGPNLARKGRARGSSQMRGTLYRNVRDGNLLSYWSPRSTKDERLILRKFRKPFNTVVIRELNDATRSWRLLNNDNAMVLAAGRRLGSEAIIIGFGTVGSGGISLMLDEATEPPKIAELELYHAPLLGSSCSGSQEQRVVLSNPIVVKPGEVFDGGCKTY
nr:hypothetical protein [Myxococcales bacterium]